MAQRDDESQVWAMALSDIRFVLPFVPALRGLPWIPAFAGMTEAVSP